MIDDEVPESAAIAEGKTIDEAIKRGLIATGWSRDQVTVEVMDPGSRTAWVNQGLAKVRLSRKTSDPYELADRITTGILRRVGFEGQVSVEQRLDHIRVLVQGEGLEEALVAEDGEGLDALQHLVSRIVSKRSGTRQLVNVDLGGYRERKERQLRDLAYQLADEVRQTGRKVLTDAMPAAERRVVHLALNEDPDITTFAIGDGLVKPIAIAPIDQAPPPEERRPADRRWSGGRREGGMREGRGDRGDRGHRGEGRGDRGESRGGRGPRRSGGGRPYGSGGGDAVGAGRSSGERGGERGMERAPRRTSRYDDRSGSGGAPRGGRGGDAGERPYRQPQVGRGQESRGNIGDRRERSPEGRSSGNVSGGRGYPAGGYVDRRGREGERRDVEGNRPAGDPQRSMHSGRGGRGRGPAEGRGSQEEGPINRSHTNLDRDLWDPIGDADLVEPEVDEFDLADTAARDEDVEDDIEDEGVVEGEIEDGDVEEDDRGRAGGDDNEAEYDAQAGPEEERASDQAPARELRPGTPGPRRDVRGRGRSGGRWR